MGDSVAVVMVVASSWQGWGGIWLIADICMMTSSDRMLPRNWPFVRGIHRSPVDFPHKGQWRRALVYSLICAWTKGWANNWDVGDLRRHCAHYDFTLMWVLEFSGEYHHGSHKWNYYPGSLSLSRSHCSSIEDQLDAKSLPEPMMTIHWTCRNNIH